MVHLAQEVLKAFKITRIFYNQIDCTITAPYDGIVTAGILNGLKPGDTVITEGAGGLTEGEEVAIAE